MRPVLKACDSSETRAEDDEEEDEDDAEVTEVMGRDVSAAAIPPLLNIWPNLSIQDGQSDRDWRSYRKTINFWGFNAKRSKD